ncbi:SgcJ/EcaC family oxidoreductase [Streptomyces sp. NBC_01754]|uniref:SgcJ/EcaC family oxidoreductase n=1 Tax=Streptomyces sp. NBC_01754 TaxID=2975930 RepID=UPI002DD7F485|nr:SgcJ/EcaC family oxidoreductase [Streptomyces sp. NBC_01754]WSC90909.1 SgcJ/EcaC family oxidoreductase [Streptomyces sp. NBC_01754]WSC96597.1 SgcJ/EcaC family oxidoreductase [Streptomyces sp. NBC_01754]
MSSKAATLVSQAKQWAGNYGPYSNGEEGAAYTAPLRVRAAWESQDADAVAGMFTQNGSLLLGDEQLTSREEIRDHLKKAFQGRYRGTRIPEEPLEVRLLAPDVALAVTQGGLVAEGASTWTPENEYRAMWVLAKRDGDWQVVCRQTSPVKG